jgi:hypothetical protein
VSERTCTSQWQFVNNVRKVESNVIQRYLNEQSWLLSIAAKHRTDDSFEELEPWKVRTWVSAGKSQS